jgi:hypothetical protein
VDEWKPLDLVCWSLGGDGTKGSLSSSSRLDVRTVCSTFGGVLTKTARVELEKWTSGSRWLGPRVTGRRP